MVNIKEFDFYHISSRSDLAEIFFIYSWNLINSTKLDRGLGLLAHSGAELLRFEIFFMWTASLQKWTLMYGGTSSTSDMAINIDILADRSFN